MGFGRGGFGFVPGRPPSSKDEAISASPESSWDRPDFVSLMKAARRCFYRIEGSQEANLQMLRNRRLRNPESLGCAAKGSGIGHFEKLARLTDLDWLLHGKRTAGLNQSIRGFCRIDNKIMTKYASKRLAYCSIFETYRTSEKNSSKVVFAPRKTKVQNAAFQTRQAGRSVWRQTARSSRLAPSPGVPQQSLALQNLHPQFHLKRWSRKSRRPIRYASRIGNSVSTSRSASVSKTGTTTLISTAT